MSGKPCPPATELDPRMTGWPCGGCHKPGKDKSNKSATWQSCDRCGLRLKYVTKAKATGETRAIGPPPDQVAAAQMELQLVYDADQMNEKIFNGKLMELRGRQLVQKGGRGRTTVQVRADEKLAEAMMASTCEKGYQKKEVEKMNPLEMPMPTSTTRVPKTPSKAAPSTPSEAAPSTPPVTSRRATTQFKKEPTVHEQEIPATLPPEMVQTGGPILVTDSDEEFSQVTSPEVPL